MLAGFLLTLGAALGYALLDVQRKLLADRVAVVPLLLWLTAGAVPLYGAWLAIVAVTETETIVSRGYLAPALSSAALNVGANLAYLRALQYGGLSATIPLLSLSPVFAALIGVPMLGELPTAMQWIGIVLVVVGAGLMSGGSVGGEVVRARKGAALMIVVALLWSLALPFDKLALRHGAAAVHGFVLHLAIAIAVAVLLVATPRRSRPSLAVSGSWRLIAAAVVCGAAALGFQLVALGVVFAGFVETFKRGLGSAVALVIGRLVFGETVDTRRIAAVAMMAAGVAAILLPTP